MMDKLNESITKFLSQFKETKQLPIKIVARNDVNGVLSTAILTKAFQREEWNFSVSMIGKLNDQKLQELSYDSSKTVLFLGLGSSKISKIRELIKNKLIFIIDNYKDVDRNFNVNILNPVLDDEDICLSGMTYLFAKQMNKRNSIYSHLGFMGSLVYPSRFDNLLLQEAQGSKKITVARGLQMFQGRTLEVQKVIEQSYYPYLPQLSGVGSAVYKFLREVNIDNKRFIDLSEEELKKLYSGIIIRMMGKESKGDIFGNIYLLNNEKENSLIRDVNAFVSVLDSCCKINQGNLGVGLCLGEENFRREALYKFEAFREEVINCLNWFNSNRRTEKVNEKENYVILKFESNFKDYIISTIIEIIKKSKVYKRRMILCGVWYGLDGNAHFRIVPSTVEIDYSQSFFTGLAKDLGLEEYYLDKGLRFSISQSEEEEFMKLLLLRVENRKIEEIVH